MRWARWCILLAVVAVACGGEPNASVVASPPQQGPSSEPEQALDPEQVQPSEQIDGEEQSSPPAGDRSLEAACDLMDELVQRTEELDSQVASGELTQGDAALLYVPDLLGIFERLERVAPASHADDVEASTTQLRQIVETGGPQMMMALDLSEDAEDTLDRLAEDCGLR